jgi:hypothetical protein
MIPKLSKSSIGLYLKCPKAFFFAYIQKIKSKMDYPRLMGIYVHRFIKEMYEGITYPLYYRSLDTAKDAWKFRWNKALIKYRPIIRFPDSQQEKEHKKAGWSCIQKYWEQNIEKPRPLEIEKRYEVLLPNGFRFIGVFDQIRKTSIETIKKIRPDLIVDNQLIPGYDPVLIIDYKTGIETWNLAKYNPNATPLEIAAHQFELHDDLQVTAYWWLYQRTHNLMPVGFYWYHLRTGEYFFTYRTEKDYKTFFEVIGQVVSGINAERYPMQVGPDCKSCDFFEVCIASRENRPLLITNPSSEIGENTTRDKVIQPNIVVKKARQLRFKLEIPEGFPTLPIVAGSSTTNDTGTEGEDFEKLFFTNQNPPTIVTLPSYEDDFKEDFKEDEEKN